MPTRWKPAYGEQYWNIVLGIKGIAIDWSCSAESSIDKRLYGYGNCFKTRKQAEVAIEKIKQVLMENREQEIECNR